MRKRPERARLLVIDDDAMSCELLCVLLEASNYRVSCERSGDAGLARLAAGHAKPEIVLTDLQMPGTTGKELARALRRACGPETVLFAMSASEPTGSSISGFDGFLMKPLDASDVTAALKAHAHPGTQTLKLPTTPMRTAHSAKLQVAAKGRYKIKATPGRIDSLAASASNQVRDVLEHEKRNKDCLDSASASGALDERIYGQLAAAMPIVQLHQMYALCVRDARERILSMRSLTSNEDAAQFIRQAHAIKGGCGMLGAFEIHGLAGQLESGGLEAYELYRDANVNPLDELSDACDRLESILGSRALKKRP